MENVRDDWSDFVIGSVPTLYYIPNFVTDTEQEQLLNQIYHAPISKWKSLKNRRLQNWGGIVHEKGLLAQDLPPWLTRITQRIFEESRLFPAAINHVLINEYLPNQGIMAHQDGPAYFPVVAIISLGSSVVMDFTPHSSLQNGLNSLENDIRNKVSAGQSVDSETDKSSENYHPFSVLLMPRSLLIFKDKTYSEYLHGIKDCEVQPYEGAVNVAEVLELDGINKPPTGLEDDIEKKEARGAIHRTTNRISLTCRFVPNVSKKMFRFR